MEKADFIESLSSAASSWVPSADVLALAVAKNGWFTPEQTTTAIEHWKKILNKDEISQWLASYPFEDRPEQKIGVIMAGNIPLVGLHDALCVLASGYHLNYKPSSDDEVLINDFLDHWIATDPKMGERITKVDRIKDVNGVIATGSNNTARYFEYYFREIPHLIRMNRTSVAILDGNETEEDLKNIGKDIFSYFGKGCRNVSAVLIPDDDSLQSLMRALSDFSSVLDHHKWANNYTYHKAIWLMNMDPHFDTGFISLKESDDIHSPLGTIYYKKYRSLDEAKQMLQDRKEEIQAVVGNIKEICDTTPGQSQFPPLDWYADGINTMEFLAQSMNQQV